MNFWNAIRWIRWQIRHELYEKYVFYKNNIVSVDLQVLYLLLSLLKTIRDHLFPGSP